MSNGARSGARVAIVNQDIDDITAAVEAEAYGLDGVVVEFDGNVEGLPDCPQANVECCPSHRVRDRSLGLHPVLPSHPIFSQLVGSITVSSESQMPIERVAP